MEMFNLVVLLVTSLGRICRMSPMFNGHDGTPGFLLSSWCCISFQLPVACVKPEAFVAVLRSWVTYHGLNSFCISIEVLYWSL